MLNKVTNRLVSGMQFNLSLDNAYEDVFNTLSEHFYSKNVDEMLSDYVLNNLSLYDFNLLESYNKLIAGIIQKNIFKKNGIESNRIYVKFNIISLEEYCHKSYTVYKPELTFDKQSFIREFLKEFKHVKLDFTSFGVYYSLEDFDSDTKKLEALNIIEKTKSLASQIETDLYFVKQLLTDIMA